MRALRFIAIVGAFGAGIVGAAMVSLEIVREAGTHWRRLTVGVVLILAALGTMGLLTRYWKRQRQTDPIMICGGGWALVVGFVLLSFGGCADRMRCGAWQLKEGTWLRQVVQYKRDAVRNGEPQPTLFGIFSAQKPGYFYDICSCVHPRDVPIGEQTMEDFERGLASAEVMEQEFSAVSADTPGWERLAYFVACNDAATLKSNHPDVIIGYTLPSRMRSHATFQIAYSDGHVECMAGGIEFERLEESIAVARDLGLAVPPDDLVTKGRKLEAQLRRER